MLRIRRNDQVMILSGRDKGNTGKVLRVYSKDQRVLVENINVVKKSQRKTQQNPNGGILEIEAPLHISKVMLMDKKTNQPSRFSVSVLKDGTKVRISKNSGEVI